MSTSQIGQIRSQIVASWAARLVTDGVTNVDVKGYFPGDELTKADLGWLGEIRSSQQQLTFGSSGGRSEDVTIEGGVWVLKPGAGQTIAEEAEDRALLILASLENTLRTDSSLSAVFLFGEITEYGSKPMPSPDGMIGSIEFTITGTVNL